MYTLLDNAASNFANSTSVDRIGLVPLADPMNCVVAETVLDAVLVVEAVEAAEAAVVVEEAVVAEEAVAAEEAQVADEAQVAEEQAVANNAEMEQFLDDMLWAMENMIGEVMAGQDEDAVAMQANVVNEGAEATMGDIG